VCSKGCGATKTVTYLEDVEKCPKH
jgi:hypothetical protein